MTEHDMQLHVVRHYWPRHTFCPNIGVYGGEADLLMLTSAGLTTEFEIKVTRSDFFADRKKESKHRLYAEVYARQKPAIVVGIDREWQIRFMPNRFVYAMPAELRLTPNDVPEYAGLWLWDGEGWIVAKPEPYMHRVKQNWSYKMARGLWMRYAERVMLQLDT